MFGKITFGYKTEISRAMQNWRMRGEVYIMPPRALTVSPRDVEPSGHPVRGRQSGREEGPRVEAIHTQNPFAFE